MCDVAVTAARVNSWSCGKVGLIHFLFVFSTLLRKIVYLRFSFHRLQLGHIVTGDISFQLGGVGASKPPDQSEVSIDDIDQ